MTEHITNTTDLPETTDAPLSECGHDRFERNHYFHGKLMTARDMAAEQAYHAGQRRAHARSVGGSGVAWGLETSVTTDGDAVTVSVDRGYAIDGCGRAIVVPQDRETTVTDPDVLGADEVTVELAYEACLMESVPVSGAESACEDECAYNRVLEAYRIEVSPGRPDGVAKAVPDVTFPDMDDYDRSGRDQPDSGDPDLSTIAISYRAAPGASTGDPTTGTVFVGAFEAPTGEGREYQPLADAHPPSLVYTNDMLYAATARHAADFRNPHQVTLTTATPDDGSGAAVRILDDESDDPDVTVDSADGSVDVSAEPDQHVDLSVEAHVEAVLEDRIEPLERYTVQQALKYTALVFSHAAERFESAAGDAASVARRIARLARGASDGRLQADSDAAAAEELDVLDANWDVDQELSGDVYRQLAEQLAERTDEFAAAVEAAVTENSFRRLERARERFQAAVDAEERPTDPLPIASAQDDVADAVEWLEPVDVEGPGSGTLTPALVSGHRGDIVELSIDLVETDSATLRIGSEDVGYQSRLDIEAGTVGRAVTIRMNTYLAGRSAEIEPQAFQAADDADSVTATLEVGDSGSDDPRLLDPAEYELRLAVDGEPADEGVLSLEARSTDDLTALAGSADVYDELDSVDALDAAREGGTLSEADTVGRDATVVAAIDVNGIFGAIAHASGGSPTTVTAEGLEALEEDGLVEIMMFRERGRRNLMVWRSVDTDSARILTDDREGRLFMVVDVAEASFAQIGGGDTSPDGEYELSFEVSGESVLADEDERVADTLTITGPIDIETVRVPDVVGMHLREARGALARVELDAAIDTVQVSTVDQLRSTGYDHVLEQSSTPGSEAEPGETIELRVLVSRPVTELEGIASGRAQELATVDIEWVHDLVEVDPETVADNTSFGVRQIRSWQQQAEGFLQRLHSSLRFELDLDTAGRVVDAFEGADHRAILEMDEGTVESMITEATNEGIIAPADAQRFLTSGTGLRFDETNFEVDFDDIDFDPTG